MKCADLYICKQIIIIIIIIIWIFLFFKLYRDRKSPNYFLYDISNFVILLLDAIYMNDIT